MNDVSSYARMIEAKVVELKSERVIDGIAYQGTANVVACKVRDIEMQFGFFYNDEEVTDFSSRCDLVDPEEEFRDTIADYGLGIGQPGCLQCHVIVTSQWFVVDARRMVGDRFVKWSAPIVYGLTSALRRQKGYEDHIALDGVCWSTNWPEEKNAEHLELVEKNFTYRSTPYRDGWEETLVDLCKGLSK